MATLLNKVMCMVIGGFITLLSLRGYFYDYFDNMPKEMVNVAYFSYLTGCLQSHKQPMFESQTRTCKVKAVMYAEQLRKAIDE